MGGWPVFTLRDGKLVTMGEIKTLLGVLLADALPKVTTRAICPALPTLLAREGVTEEGRWTNKSYNHYVRKGHSGDWRGLLDNIRGLSI